MKTFQLIAGPCVVEDEATTRLIAQTLKRLTDERNIPFIFKTSYKKANRTSMSAFSGIGDMKALQILSDIGQDFNIKTTTDVHSVEEVKMTSQAVDILQIPAFLCRQTELLVACARSGKPVNIKKGQFASWRDMFEATIKLKINGCRDYNIIERGTTFGYNDLVIDFRNIYMLQNNGIPTIVDLTHSLGKEEGIPNLTIAMAKAAIAMGADGIFIETHPNPRDSKSDGKRMFPLDYMEPLLDELIKINQ